uniref:Uncharacterized protein n=1 Tax=Arundo donax TaxID=35708 RepID=A0A0A9CLM2_ARUDO
MMSPGLLKMVAPCMDWILCSFLHLQAMPLLTWSWRCHLLQLLYQANCLGQISYMTLKKSRSPIRCTIQS